MIARRLKAAREMYGVHPVRMTFGYFSRLRRGEMGHFHHVSRPYLLRYAESLMARRCPACGRWRSGALGD